MIACISRQTTHCMRNYSARCFSKCFLIIMIIIIVAANRCHKVQQRRSSTRSNRKQTMAPLAAAIRSMCDLGAQLTTNWNRLYAGFCQGGKTGELREKPLSQRRKPTQTQPTYGVWSGNRTSVTLVGGECSDHCAIPVPPLPNFLSKIYTYLWQILHN